MEGVECRRSCSGGRFLRVPTDPQCASNRFGPVRHASVVGTKTDFRDLCHTLLTRRKVEALCRLSTSSIYRFMRDGLFFKHIRIGQTGCALVCVRD
ncbi:MAG: AlpA family phage regulatory protein [Acidimicrobiia bacterium]|nr:AlpA family phage regulatory protein [Acidimicrobiia bacterium]MYB72354.1 AlpA family phage regulatory protein [Acidimicrobiia bacterium]MYH99719.1 AlpA family phage regulatory protein [Acidimicrobiia bacterium]